MNLPDLKQLDKIITLCRKRGVKTIKIDNVELTLSDDQPQSNYKKNQEKKESQGRIDSEELTEEQLIAWSTGGFDQLEQAKIE